MAVFLLKAFEGSDYLPPACTVPAFDDVPCANPFAPWIYELAARAITGGCGGGNYCPGNIVSRAADGGVPGQDVRAAAPLIGSRS